MVREKEYGQGHHLAKNLQFVGGGWLKVKWQWKEWPMSNVHKSWIVSSDNAHRPRRVTDYNYDNEIRIGCHSVGGDRLFVRYPFNDDTTP